MQVLKLGSWDYTNSMYFSMLAKLSSITNQFTAAFWIFVFFSYIPVSLNTVYERYKILGCCYTGPIINYNFERVEMLPRFSDIHLRASEWWNSNEANSFGEKCRRKRWNEKVMRCNISICSLAYIMQLWLLCRIHREGQAVSLPAFISPSDGRKEHKFL